MYNVLFIDFETRSACDLKKSGSHVYAAHPSTSVLCLGYAFGEHPPDIWTPSDSTPLDILEHVRSAGTVCGHNIGGFEIPIWNEVLAKRHGWPILYPEQCVDTMARAYAMGLPGSLDGASAAMGITKQKDMKGHRVMMQLSQPRDILEGGEVVWWDDKEKFQKLYEYCKQDVEVERELYRRLPALSDQEEALWRLDHKINARGIQIDTQRARAALQIVELEKERLDKEIREVTSGAVATCTAAGQLTDWLRWNGVETEGVAKSDVISLLSRQDLPSKCRAALLLRQEAAKSSTAKLSAMLLSASSDGRVRGTLQYHGAATGRWAGRKLQVQNFPRPQLEQGAIDSVFKILGEIDV